MKNSTIVIVTMAAILPIFAPANLCGEPADGGAAAGAAAPAPGAAPAASLPSVPPQLLFGFLAGITRDAASGQAVPAVTVTVRNVTKGAEHTTVSGADGAFAVPNLEPGQYEIVATKEGFMKSSA